MGNILSLWADSSMSITLSGSRLLFLFINHAPQSILRSF
ncbi:hypothetical protein CSC03_4593 [Enterobacter hormaechei]|nr:hypothetical protein CSC03_4593 [Enterobacter hormaechei]